MSNLRLLNETTGTSVYTISVTDVFTSNFDIYKIVLYSSSASEKEDHLRFINSSGSVISSSNYDYAQLFHRSYSSFSQVRDTSDTKLRLITGSEDNFGGNAVIYVFNPTSSSSYTFMIAQSNGFNSASGGGSDGVKYIGVLKNTSIMKGFGFRRASGTYDSLKVRTYGLRVDN